ncbi:MAG: alpha/beta fold hydrolase [Longimicrobiales bacterium]
MRHQSRQAIFATTSFLVAALAGSCGPDVRPEEPEHGESILERVVHLEPELLTSIPETFRWCDRIDGLEKRRIDVGGAALYVEVEGQGMPLVLINGGPGGTHHYFHPWFSRARDFARVIYYDQRGCGLSDFEPGEGGYSVEQAVGDLDAIRAALGFEKWAVMGFSYGGFLAQLYTVLHPERVSGLILLGATPGIRSDLGPSRQSEFISEAERARMGEVRELLREFSETQGLSRQQAVNLSIYNAFLNGDWKRQHFYRPSPERMAQVALYEWVHDDGFNSVMGQSQSGWDLTGAFEGNPIPTLILEGGWDLTWGEEKKDALLANHPNGRMVVFEDAGHGIYDEQPDRFFRVLQDFMESMPRIDTEEIEAYKASLESWVAAMRARPDMVIDRTDWGATASRELAAGFVPAWLDSLDSYSEFLRMGFALYDVERYEDGLMVFHAMEEAFADLKEPLALSLIWEGHMLDLLGRRSEALPLYREVAEMDLTDEWSHGQYGLRYQLSPWARERMASPFVRKENSVFE